MTAISPRIQFLLRTTQLPFCIALLIVGNAALAQQAVQPPAQEDAQPRTSESIDVVITNLDVVVTDSKGKHVRGLTAADFEVREKGKPRTVTNLEEIVAPSPSAPSPTAPETANQVAEAAVPQSAPATVGRRILLLLDDMTLMPLARRRIVDAARSWVSTNVRPTDRVSVVSTGRSLSTNLRWTNDRAAIQLALEGVRLHTPSMIAQDRRDTTDAMSFSDDVGRYNMVPKTLKVTEARAYAEKRVHDSRQSVSAMMNSLAYFPASDEKKVMVLFGEGLQESPGRDFLLGLEMLNESTAYTLKPELKKFSQAAFRKGVAIYTVNPGFNDPEDGGLADPRTIMENRTGYQYLTQATGGLEFFGAPADQALNGIAVDLNSYYSLGYRGTGSPVKPEDIEVKVRNGLHARLSLSPAPAASDAVLRDLVLAHLIEPSTSNDLQIALRTDPLPPKGSAQQVRLSVLIPISKLKFERQKGEIHGGFDVYVVTGDDQGNASEVNRGRHLIHWPQDAARNAGSRPLQWTLDLPVPAGHTRISVAVRDGLSNSIGFATLAVAQPAAAALTKP